MDIIRALLGDTHLLFFHNFRGNFRGHKEILEDTHLNIHTNFGGQNFQGRIFRKFSGIYFQGHIRISTHKLVQGQVQGHTPEFLSSGISSGTHT